MALRAANSLRMVFPRDYNLTDEEARPWRNAVSKVVSPDMVMKLHIPIMVPEFTQMIRRHAQSPNASVP